jgi:hypothetical protein
MQMSKFTKTALVALALAGTIGSALAQQADQATPAPTQQVQPAPVRSRVATRQILIEPTAPAAPVAAAPVATAQAEVAAPQVQAQVQPVDAPAPKVEVVPAPKVEVVPAQPQVVAPPVIVKKPQYGDGYGYRHYGYSPRYAGGYGHNCHRGY